MQGMQRAPLAPGQLCGARTVFHVDVEDEEQHLLRSQRVMWLWVVAANRAAQLRTVPGTRQCRTQPTTPHSTGALDALKQRQYTNGLETATADVLKHPQLLQPARRRLGACTHGSTV